MSTDFNTEQRILKAYRKDQPVGPGNLPQGQKATTRILTPTSKETYEYNQAVDDSRMRGYETAEEKYLIGRYEHQFTDKRD